MIRLRLKGIFFNLMMIFLTIGCNSQREIVVDDGKLNVFVSIPPQAYLVERISGDLANVTVLLESGDNPHNFELTPNKIRKLSEAELVLSIGLPLEENVLHFIRESNIRARVVPTHAGIKRTNVLFFEHGHNTNDVHSTEDKEHDNLSDPHIWLSPEYLKHLAVNTAQALIAGDSLNKETYRENLSLFLADIEETDKKIAAALTPFQGQSFYVYHPAFGFFGKHYGIIQVEVETGGKSPSSKQIKNFIDRAVKDGVKIIFVQPQFDRKAAEIIARAIDGSVIPIDPMEKDVLNNLLSISEEIGKSFGS